MKIQMVKNRCGNLIKSAFIIVAIFAISISGNHVLLKQSQTASANPVNIPMTVPNGIPTFSASTWTDIQNAVNDASTGDVLIEITNDIITDSGAIDIPIDRNVYLRSDPAMNTTFSIYQDSLTFLAQRHLRVWGGSLSIENIRLTRDATTVGIAGGGLDVLNGGRLEMFSGSVISNNHSIGNGGGVMVFNINGTFIMHDGKITRNTADSVGGGVQVFNSSFTMVNGEISGNTAGSGGGVALGSQGIFIMNGGKIDGNQGLNAAASGIASLSAGGVFMNGVNTQFVMNHGIISNNVAAMNGGGVGIWNVPLTNFTINGGQILNNIANNNGGGVHTHNYIFLTIGSGAIFSGNIAGSAHDFAQSALYPNPNLPVGAGGITTIGGSITNIAGWASTSIAGTHLLNNYDINYVQQPISYQTVIFNPNGGVFSGANKSPVRLIADYVAYTEILDSTGSLFNLPLSHPTRNGYTFAGWFNSLVEANNLGSEDGRIKLSDAVTSEADRTFYARWIAIPSPPDPPIIDNPDAPNSGVNRDGYFIGSVKISPFMSILSALIAITLVSLKIRKTKLQ